MIKFRTIFSCIILFSVIGCERKNTHRYTANETCHNLTLAVKNLQTADKVYLLYDTHLLLRQKVDSLSTIDFTKNFCNRYRKEGVLRVMIMANDQVLIDTSLRVKSPRNSHYIAVDRTLARVTLIADSSAKAN